LKEETLTAGPSWKLGTSNVSIMSEDESVDLAAPRSGPRHGNFMDQEGVSTTAEAERGGNTDDDTETVNTVDEKYGDHVSLGDSMLGDSNQVSVAPLSAFRSSHAYGSDEDNSFLYDDIAAIPLKRFNSMALNKGFDKTQKIEYALKANLARGVVQRTVYFDAQGAKHVEHEPWGLWAFSDFSGLGVGVRLYFLRLKMVVLMMLMMGIMNAPAMYAYLQYDNIGPAFATAFKLEQLSLGNVGDRSTTASADLKSETEFLWFDLDRTDLGIMASVLDGLGVMVGLCFWAYMVRQHAHASVQHKKLSHNVSNYSVLVKGLPKDFTDLFSFETWFQDTYGQVHDVAMVETGETLLELYRSRGLLAQHIEQLNEESEDENAERMVLIRRKEALDAKIHDEKETPSKRLLYGAFVTFECRADQRACLQHNSSYWYMRLKRRFKQFAESFHKFQGHKVQITAAPDPSNLRFEHLNFSWKEKVGRRVGTAAVYCMVLAIATTCTFLATSNRTGLDFSESGCPKGITASAAASASSGSIERTCYCRELGLTEMLRDAVDCEEVFWEVMLDGFLGFLAIICILSFNTTFVYLSQYLVKLEKHFIRTTEEMKIAGRLTISIILSSGVVAVAAAANAQEWVSSSFVDFLWSGKYKDFSSRWYTDVGVLVTFSTSVFIFSPHGIPMVQLAWRSCRRRCISEKDTQQRILVLLAGYNFHCAERNAVDLAVFVVILIYSSGIPLLYFTGVLVYGSRYWVDKISLLRLYDSPPKYDERLNRHFLFWVPYAFLLHEAFAVWMFSARQLSTAANIGLAVLSEVDTIDNSDLSFGERMSGGQVIFQLINCVLLVGLCVTLLFVHPERLLRCIIDNTSKEEVLEHEVTITSLKNNGVKLSSYHMEDCARYAPAFMRTTSMKQMQRVGLHHVADSIDDFVPRFSISKHSSDRSSYGMESVSYSDSKQCPALSPVPEPDASAVDFPSIGESNLSSVLPPQEQEMHPEHAMLMLMSKHRLVSPDPAFQAKQHSVLFSVQPASHEI
jgi:hypothetical protein